MRLLLFFVLLTVLPACAGGAGGARVSPDPSPSLITSSPAGQAIQASTFGSGPTRVYLIASIHGDEPEALAALPAVRAALDGWRGGATVRLVDDMNPDGSVAGTRGNARGVDLNRNWPATNFRASKRNGSAPLSEAETAAVYADIVRFDPHIIVVLHSARGGPFVNYDGPPTAAILAEAFAAAARASGDARWRVVPDMGYPTPGSMGSYFGKDRGVPILTVELRRGEEASKVPAPVVAGVRSVLETRGLALAPLSRSAGVARLARGTPGAPAPEDAAE